MQSPIQSHKGIGESIEYIKLLASDGFFGTLELRFEDGNIVHITEHKSLKPYSLKTPDKPRSNYEKGSAEYE